MGHDAEKQKLIVDTPFLKGDCFYAELEQGLWVMHSTMYYKNNVSLSPVYDAFLPSRYYCFTINFTENTFSSNYFESNNLKIDNESISFLKPKSDYLHCHFKGSKTSMLMIYFSSEWLNKNILSQEVTPSTQALFSKTRGFINYKYERKLFQGLVDQFLETFTTSVKPNIFELKKSTYRFFDIFLENLPNIDGFELKSNSLKNTVVIKKVEYYLMSRLYDKFPGIDFLAKKFKISPTKLKNDFKAIYNMSLYQYFQSKQMDLALKYVREDMLIKEVAEKFNYENTSKFSKAFKKHHQFLPSEIK